MLSNYVRNIFDYNILIPQVSHHRFAHNESLFHSASIESLSRLWVLISLIFHVL